MRLIISLVFLFATTNCFAQEQEFINVVKDLLQGDELKTFQSKFPIFAHLMFPRFFVKFRNVTTFRTQNYIKYKSILNLPTSRRLRLSAPRASRQTD